MAEIKVETAKTGPGNVPPRRDAKPSVAVADKTLTGQRTEAVNGIFQIIGLGFIMTGQFADAGAIDMHGPNIATEVADLAAKNEQVGRAVDSLLQVGPYAGLVVAVMPLVMQIMANHKIVPAEKMAAGGVVPPAALEAQVKTQMARQAMEAMRQQKAAEEELAAMQDEFTAHLAEQRATAENGQAQE